MEAGTGPVEHFDVVVVGAGPSGLAAAWRLERMGIQRFAVLDLESQVGGTSTYGKEGLVPHPWGAHYVPVPGPENPALNRILDEMGVFEASAKTGEREVREELVVREPEERLFEGGNWYEGLFPRELCQVGEWEELQRFNREVESWVKWRDPQGRRAFTLPTCRCSDAAELTALDRISAATWLDERGYRSPRLRWYIEYACRDDYGCTLITTSAWAMLFYFASRSREPGQPPAPFITWPEGNGRVVRHFERILSDRIRLQQLVTDIHPTEDGVDLVAYHSGREALLRYHADRVILAIPKFLLRHVLRPWRERPPSFLEHFTYGSWLVGNVHLSGRPQSKGFPMAWDNVLFDSPALGYVVATHQTLRDRGPTVWTWYNPLVEPDPPEARRRLEAQDQASCVDALFGDLGRAHPDLEKHVLRADFWRWGHAMVRPVPGFHWGPHRRQAALPVGRVHFAHSDLSGMGLLEEAVDHGVRAAEEVAQAQGVSAASLRG